ncbi:nuclear transport factor 2 family protein [Chitinophagaceae bacterium 26-R-25]|nr:nuclear transport factor 2 family protein [Chitinophagaceae bacterium 26-R-25]
MTLQERNKQLVLEAFDAAFNRKETDALERFWSPNYIQHSTTIPPGREGLKKAIASRPPEFHYEHGLIVSEGDFVMVHGRFSNIGEPRAIIVVNILRIENGLLAEHWDVIEKEVTKEESKSGLPMFKDYFANS